MRLAAWRHERQRSKGDGAPFLTHPVAVALLCARAGEGDETVAAALLHDVLEDTPTTRDEMAAEVGEAVTSIVEQVTKPEDLPWREQSRRYVDRLRGARREALAVAAADKIHNLFRLIRAYELEGPVVEKRFNSTFKERIATYEEVREVVARRWPDCPLLPELERQLARARRVLPIR